MPVNNAKYFCSEPTQQSEPEFSDLIDEIVTNSTERETNFAKIFKNSKFVQLGDFDGRLVVGKIVHRVGNDLYIDFGSKFNTVCKSPADKEGYLVGASVLLRLHDPELSERFLGSRYDLTLLEADATLLGLYGKRRTVEAEKTKE
ncbi:unnamed protein product [Bursaphelenchus xylophilus]|uniref:(pine wood nematode) hypothetical protein n=1 Tax=Bursaphelenchus xylophilus TaxID=6326 RepID=A0A1I7SMR1_BURXY|nr:unnamed protein product [Bursaphelenchus xylophilus]CAG9130321.1 unnamed protein product [Bursaphelenchus xylophilus]